ncbi:MAG: dienelactone hydrolase family protein [Alphaproteobacteria bacterium]
MLDGERDYRKDPDAISLVRDTKMTRRTFAVTTLAVGFAMAVRPVAAQAIKTDEAGLTAGEVKIPAEGGMMVGYRAMPATGDKFPIILVVQEIFGVHEHIRDVCRRFAKAGYCAVAPELYARQGDPSKISDIPTIIKEIVSKVPDAQVLADLDASAKWAAASSKGDASKLSITGFCWGGRIAWLYAAHNPNVKSAIVWYGRVVGDPNPMNPKHPIDVAAQIKAPVLGLYGGKDGGIPVESLDKMKAALAAAGNTKSQLVVYPDAGHAFHADYRPSYVKAAAEDGWKKAVAWLKANAS